MTDDIFLPEEECDFLFDAYNLPPGALDGCQFVIAYSNLGDYEESLEVVFVKDGKLYWESGSHCSCDGFEPWDPGEVEVSTLRAYWRWANDETAKAKFDDLEKWLAAK